MYCAGRIWTVQSISEKCSRYGTVLARTAPTEKQKKREKTRKNEKWKISRAHRAATGRYGNIPVRDDPGYLLTCGIAFTWIFSDKKTQ